MKRLLALLLPAFLLAAAAIGCGGSDKDKGKNSNMDRPKADRNT